MALALRSLKPADVEPIEEILLGNRPVFSDVEVATAVEMVEEGLSQNPADPDPYHFLVAENATGVVAYACFGTVPMTQGTWDLYWIAVRPSQHRGGVGARLLGAVEAEIAREGGHLVVVETSSRKDYDKTRAFYERQHYQRAATFKDFYRRGDDKVVYVKYLG